MRDACTSLSWWQYTSAVIVVLFGSSSKNTTPRMSHHTDNKTLCRYKLAFGFEMSFCFLSNHGFRPLTLSYRIYFSSQVTKRCKNG